MHRFFVSDDMINGQEIKISGEDANHISKVLRLRAGDMIEVSDGKGREFLCSLSGSDKRTVTCSIVEERVSVSDAPISVDLYQGIPKSTKMDLIIQKCTELGISRIVPVVTERVVVKFGDDRDTGNKKNRWQRIAIEAAKQSGRGRIPEISDFLRYDEAIKFAEGYDLVLIPYEKENTKGLKHILKGKNNINSIAIFIGPEGGFTDEEIIMGESIGAVAVTLGPRILRTETAGFATLSIIMYEIGDMGGE